ncbi:HAMP domain-containing protein [Streptomyces sp. KL116D]|uniref:HAMP domain-containing protein n=1 Tax=Streptomyces sp. KL116D TaxID=3045152 RepID=UPI0035567557
MPIVEDQPCTAEAIRDRLRPEAMGNDRLWREGLAGAAETTVRRPAGLSVRLKLTLSYAGFLMVAGACCSRRRTWWLLRSGCRPMKRVESAHPHDLRAGLRCPSRSHVMAVLLVVGLLALGSCRPYCSRLLTRITDATRRAATGRWRTASTAGRQDEFRELADAFDAMLGHGWRRTSSSSGGSRQRLARAAHPAGDLEDAPGRGPRRSDQATPAPAPDRLHAVNTRAIDPTEAVCCCSAGPSQRSFTREPSTCRSWRRRRRRGAAPPSRKTGTASPSRPRGDDRFARAVAALLLQLTTNLVHNAIVHNLHARASARSTTSAQPAP